MKALSLWQPWATAIALGSKRVETRSWKTDYRGPIAIHAAKHCVKQEMDDLCFENYWIGALHLESEIFETEVRIDLDRFLFGMPFGSIVAVCRLVDCKETEDFDQTECLQGEMPFMWCEEDLGDFSPGRFGWMFEDIRRIVKPIPYRGQQGLFDVELTHQQWHEAGSNSIRIT